MTNTQIEVGLLSGNGSTIVVSCGFIPDYVEVVDTTNRNLVVKWFSSMSTDTGIKIDTSSVGSMTSGGISAYPGSSSAAPGFKIGTTTSVAAAQLGYLAVRSNRGLVPASDASRAAG